MTFRNTKFTGSQWGLPPQEISNIRQYLLFRGFHQTSKAFETELKQDKDNKAFRVDKIMEQINSSLTQLDITGLRDYWLYLEQNLFLPQLQTPPLQQSVINGQHTCPDLSAIRNDYSDPSTTATTTTSTTSGIMISAGGGIRKPLPIDHSRSNFNASSASLSSSSSNNNNNNGVPLNARVVDNRVGSGSGGGSNANNNNNNNSMVGGRDMRDNKNGVGGSGSGGMLGGDSSSPIIDEQPGEGALIRLCVGLFKLYAVQAYQSGRGDKLMEFFEKMAPQLTGRQEWKDWFALPYLKNAEDQTCFGMYFSKQWQDQLLLSLHNYICVALARMRKPAILNYEEDYKRIKDLEYQNQLIGKQLAESQEKLNAYLNNGLTQNGLPIAENRQTAIIEEVVKRGQTDIDEVKRDQRLSERYSSQYDPMLYHTDDFYNLQKFSSSNKPSSPNEKGSSSNDATSAINNKTNASIANNTSSNPKIGPSRFFSLNQQKPSAPRNIVKGLSNDLPSSALTNTNSPVNVNTNNTD